MENATETPEPVITEPEAPAPPQIGFAAGGKARERNVTLDWPLMVDGNDLKVITVRRLTGGEVVKLQEALTSEGASDAVMLSHFTGHSEHTINQLDQDDFDSVKETVFNFLPKRMRKGMELEMAQSQSPDS